MTPAQRRLLGICCAGCDTYIDGPDDPPPGHPRACRACGGARAMELAWPRDIMRQASHYDDVAIYVKQLGAVWARDHRSQDRAKGGHMPDWPADLRVRDFPRAAGVFHG